MLLSPVQFILYVSDQAAARDFYSRLLDQTPSLDVPGMTEFELGSGCKLGLMPEKGIARIICPSLPDPASGNGLPRCELYLPVDNLPLYYERALAAGARKISEPLPRDWGHTVAYLADADGHVIAIADIATV